ncbi:MAG TPA: ABC transporter ATP-binding protein [Actinomycetota bacterium]|nr:ABC transporter ATP-binding protein [Actinomycetota bacterium]
MSNSRGDIAVQAVGLGKRYRRVLAGRNRSYQTLRETLAGAATAPLRRLRRARSDKIGAPDAPEHFWALRNVSLEISHGEAVGIIGRNGAGKTTLLKILSRVTEPTEGWAELHGRVGSLLEVGTGFHPELSGRENVFLNGAILGMTKKEIASKFDEIVAFAEVEDFIETQVKHYSSGMYMRLAFSVAAYLEPEILLIDEVLAVGDVSFQAKSLGKMSEVARGGRTVLFVSHNMAAINALCDKAIWIEKGHIAQIGPSAEVTEACTRFQKQASANEERIGYGVDTAKLNHLQRGFTLTDCRIQNPANRGIGSRTGDPLDVILHYRTESHFLSPAFVVKIKDMYGQELIRLASSPMGGFHIDALHRRGLVQLSIQRLPLVAGHYVLDVEFVRPGYETIARFDAVAEFDVELFDYYGHGVALDRSKGVLVVDHSWSHEPLDSGVDAPRAASLTHERSAVHDA